MWTRALLGLAAAALLVALGSAFVLSREIEPAFLYIFAGAAAAFGLGAVLSRGSAWYRALLFNLAVLFLALAGAEAYFAGWLQPGPQGAGAGALRHEGEFFGRMGGGYFVPDAVRGYAAAPSVAARARVWAGERLLEDVVYTTNGHGLRISPHDVEPAAAAAETVVFFGCSVTVGEGVSDRETMPWVFEERSRGRFRAVNLGFHGFGPHQMLRILETGLIDEVVDGTPPTRAVYQGLIEHIERSAGNYPAVSWGPSAPRYALREDGRLEYRGPFYSTLGTAAFQLFNRSRVFSRVAPTLLGWRRTARDIDLYVALVRRSKELFEARYHGEFTVLMWGAYDRDYRVVVERLRQASVRVLETHRIIPDIYSADWKYKLPGNQHPNAATHALLASSLLETL